MWLSSMGTLSAFPPSLLFAPAVCGCASTSQIPSTSAPAGFPPFAIDGNPCPTITGTYRNVGTTTIAGVAETRLLEPMLVTAWYESPATEISISPFAQVNTARAAVTVFVQRYPMATDQLPVTTILQCVDGWLVRDDLLDRTPPVMTIYRRWQEHNAQYRTLFRKGMDGSLIVVRLINSHSATGFYLLPLSLDSYSSTTWYLFPPAKFD